MTDLKDNILTGMLDPNALASLILELNIARRNCRAYPKEHPVVDASLRKVLAVYENLLKTEVTVVLGTTSDALMIGGLLLEKSNVVFKEFARVLFEHSIGALVLNSGLTIEELKKFIIVLSLKRDDIRIHGGIESIWAKSGIHSISVRPVRYDLFNSTEEKLLNPEQSELSGGGLWERFARGITLGGLGLLSDAESDLEPELLASILNQQYEQGLMDESGYREAITDFMVSASMPGTEIPYEKLAVFISNLNPDLRWQYMNSSFNASGDTCSQTIEGIFKNLSKLAVTETIEDIKKYRFKVSPHIMGLLQRIATHEKVVQPGSDSSFSEYDNLSNKLKTIFMEHASEELTTDIQHQNPDQIIPTEMIPSLKSEDLAILVASLNNRQIENSIGGILINLVREGNETPEELEFMLSNLSDLFRYYLQTGDYEQLLIMLDQITDGTFPLEIQNRLKEEYARSEFLDEILSGLIIWGKPRYEDIRRLVHKIGSPFVELMLDRLAEEKNMSIRRFYMDCLIQMGPITRVPISNRLSDNRWYFLRNLLVILTAQNDPLIVPIIRPLLNQPDSRIRQDVLKTLLQFQDTQAEKQVLRDLDNRDHEQLLASIQLTGKCQSPNIFNKLTKLLAQGGFSQSEYEIKSAVVRSLGEIGRADALPELNKILAAKSLLRSKTLTSLKMDIVRSLEKYSPAISKPLLTRIASEKNEIARQALESLRNISGNAS